MDPEIIYYWCRTGYEEINRYLREGKSIPLAIQKKIDKLNAYIRTFYTGYKDIVNMIREVHQQKLQILNKLPEYHLVKYDQSKNLEIFQIYRGAYFPESPFEEKGFMSFTYDPFIAYKFATMYSGASKQRDIAENHKILYFRQDTDILERYAGNCAFLYLNEYENGINEFEILFKPGKITAIENIEEKEKESIIKLFSKDIIRTGIAKSVMETMRDMGQRFENIDPNLFRKITEYQPLNKGGMLPIRRSAFYGRQSSRTYRKIPKTHVNTIFTETKLFKNTVFGVLWDNDIDDPDLFNLNKINGKTAIENNQINKETDTFIVYRINDLTVELKFNKRSIKDIWEYVQSPDYEYGDRIAIIGTDNRVKVLSFGTNDLSFNQDLVSNQITTIQQGGKKLPPKKPPAEKKSNTSPGLPARNTVVKEEDKQPSTELIKSKRLLNLEVVIGMSLNTDLGMSLMSLDEKPFKLGGKKKKTK